MNDKWSERMKQDWNQRANEDAMHYILTDNANWSSQEFFASGEEDVKRFVDPFLQKYEIEQPGILLELGCGIGRLTSSLSKRFTHVDAIDLSEEMIRRAREIHVDKSNITFIVNNGKDLSCCESEKYDMVFSYIVLQHIPDPNIVYQYFKEFGRVLRKNGLFLLQVANQNMKGHEKYLQRWQKRRIKLKQEDDILPFEDYDHAYLESKIKNYETIIQTPVEYETSIKILVDSGLKVEQVTGRGTDLMWLGGQNIKSQAEHIELIKSKRDEEFAKFKAEILQLEKDNQARLKEIHKRDGKLAQLQAQISQLEQESQAQLSRLEQESQARLREIHKRDGRLLQLQAKVESLKKELSLSIGDKILRKIKKIGWGKLVK